MMAGIVTEGTGKEAQLNGYSSAGKTGTANKIDVATHTYSHTKLVASFAGFAPVSNPAIAITVVIDTPTAGPSKYGGAVSAPVFADVAQQVLEYLGVPHDQPLKTQKEMLAAAAQPDAFDGASEDSGADLNGLFASLNDLPADDPLRNAAAASPEPTSAIAANQPTPSKPDPILQNFAANGRTTSAMPGEVAAAKTPLIAPKIAPSTTPRPNGGVVVDAGLRVPVPSFQGSPLRAAIEKAESAGLRIQPVGSGLATQQVPAAGTMVPTGTQVVVRFTR
jgi:cell division protein FtsI (penicillin-binding protein 3)